MSDTLTLPRIEPVRTRPRWIAQHWQWLLVGLIMAVQLVLTVRLIPQGYAGTDEARYIDAGHALLHELFHGGGSPYFETYFSGAPDVYSPLAAVADIAGGLAAVRLMSALFMQVAAVMLYLTGKRLFGYWPAVIACALWAGLSNTHVVGRNAIYDAMALMLMSVAAYCATRSRDARWLLLVPLAILAANAAKYITLLFDPTVVLIAAYQVRDSGLRSVLQRVLVLGSTALLTLVLGVFLAGSAYWDGIKFTTLTRQKGMSVLLGATPGPQKVILLEAWHWFGLIIALAFVSVVLASLFPRERGQVLLTLTLAITSMLVTLEALHLKSDESAGRHDDFAAWFGCMAAGYALVLVVQKLPWRSLRWSACALVAAGIVGSGILYTAGPRAFLSTDETIPATAAITEAFDARQPYLTTGQRYLLSGNDDYALIYNDHAAVQWWNLVDDNYIKYPIPGRGGNWHATVRGRTCLKLLPGCMYLEGPAGYLAAIRAHDFAVISITRPANEQISADALIEHAAETTPGYVLLTTAGGGPTWIYLPDYEHAAGKSGR